jgi:hypothetical protein
MKAWFFSHTDCRLANGDGRLIQAGKTHRVEGPLKLCRHGLHGSIKPLDALLYAPGPFVWRVELGGEVLHGNDKLCGKERTYLWGYDATDVLRHFARLCALDVIHLWDAPEAVEHYLRTGDETLCDTAVAAWVAGHARAAAGAAARLAWDAQNRRLYRLLIRGRPQ